LLTKQGRRKGGTGSIPMVNSVGLFKGVLTYSKADDVIADTSLEKGDTLMAPSSFSGTSQKQSPVVIPTTALRFLSITSAMLDGSGSSFVLFKSMMWYRKRVIRQM
jgi:hypothetical protein